VTAAPPVAQKNAAASCVAASAESIPVKRPPRLQVPQCCRNPPTSWHQFIPASRRIWNSSATPPDLRTVQHQGTDSLHAEPAQTKSKLLT